MTLDAIIKEIEKTLLAESSNTTEPLAAHSILPLVQSLAMHLKEMENQPQSGIRMAPQVPPQMALVPIVLISELRSLLQEIGFFLPIDMMEYFDSEDDLPDQVTQGAVMARTILFAIDSHLERKPLEEISKRWLEQVQQKMAERINAISEGDDDEVDDDENDEEENEDGEPTVELDVVQNKKGNEVDKDGTESEDKNAN